jgi:hypothetical protein
MPNFDGPIPGQSLTDIPGNHPWEKPARFSDVGQALDHVFDKFMEPKQTATILALLDAGTPSKSLTDATLFAGFSKGYWTPDVATLMEKPVFSMIHAIGERGGIKVKARFDAPDPIKSLLDSLGQTDHLDTPEDTPAPDETYGFASQVDPTATEGIMPKTGLMGMMK